MTHTRLDSDKIQFLTGGPDILEDIVNAPPLTPFSKEAAGYLDSVSKAILADKESRSYPDVVTFAFWCRKANLEALRKQCGDVDGRIGRGVTFHIAPSNVAVNFAYSLAAGLLAGNANIVRLSSKFFEQERIICRAMAGSMSGDFRRYVCLIKYPHSGGITDYLSSLCDTRIIWGGDDTIEAVRRSPLKARASEITFADRFSICVIDSDAYLKAENKDAVAEGFYNDTYLNDQNACTSPRIIVWTGGRASEAQDVFWSVLAEAVKKRYVLQPVQAVQKYLKFCLQSSEGGASLTDNKDNSIYRVKVEKLTPDTADRCGNSGYFIEYHAKELKDIVPVLTERCQTVSYCGIDRDLIAGTVIESGAGGADRIVPIGKTLDFSLVWDGYDLIRSLSRKIEVL